MRPWQQILIRDLEAEVVERLKQRAQENGRSLEAEVRQILRGVTGFPRIDALSEANRVRALFAGRTFEDGVRLADELKRLVPPGWSRPE